MELLDPEEGLVTATLLVEPPELAEPQILVEGSSFKHLFRARRLGPGDLLRVVDGAGRARQGVVAEVERHLARVDLGEPLPSFEAELKVELLVGSPRPERAIWLVEKATEIGVSAIFWLRTERTPRDYGESTLGRQRRVSRSALEQCGRSRLPRITVLPDWSAVEAHLATPGCVEMLDPEPGPSECPAALDGPLRLMVGPEGGFSPAERERLLELGVKTRWLGERILRVETAAVVAAARALCPPGHR